MSKNSKELTWGEASIECIKIVVGVGAGIFAWQLIPEMILTVLVWIGIAVALFYLVFSPGGNRTG